MDALNKQEIAKKELDGVTKQQSTLKSKVQAMESTAEQQKQLYKQQDELLGKGEMYW